MKVTSDSLIGKRIINLYENVITEFGGIDQGEIFLSLDTGETICFPNSLSYKNQVVSENDLTNHPSIFDELYTLGADWTIRDLLEPDEQFLSNPYVELECGLLLTEEPVSPHGTGMAGLKFYKNIEAFESVFGKEYSRLSE
ncbi:MAG: hypothetical protein Crog4KO_13350 [Crocinitomicaceae bacterium]